jgi:hypothetical protein
MCDVTRAFNAFSWSLTACLRACDLTAGNLRALLSLYPTKDRRAVADVSATLTPHRNSACKPARRPAFSFFRHAAILAQ